MKVYHVNITDLNFSPEDVTAAKTGNPVIRTDTKSRRPTRFGNIQQYCDWVKATYPVMDWQVGLVFKPEGLEPFAPFAGDYFLLDPFVMYAKGIKQSHLLVKG